MHGEITPVEHTIHFVACVQQFMSSSLGPACFLLNEIRMFMCVKRKEKKKQICCISQAQVRGAPVDHDACTEVITDSWNLEHNPVT